MMKARTGRGRGRQQRGKRLQPWLVPSIVATVATSTLVTAEVRKLQLKQDATAATSVIRLRSTSGSPTIVHQSESTQDTVNSLARCHRCFHYSFTKALLSCGNWRWLSSGNLSVTPPVDLSARHECHVALGFVLVGLTTSF